jgi:hypothetical protein
MDKLVSKRHAKAGKVNLSSYISYLKGEKLTLSPPTGRNPGLASALITIAVSEQNSAVGPKA